MGLFNIFRVCSALFLVAALGSAQANYIYDNRSGTWTPTSRTVLAPPNATSPFNYIPRDSPPTVSSTGAFQNKTGGTFGSPPTNGISRTVPVTITGTVPKSSVNKALLSRLGKGGLAGIALGAGIDVLLDGIGALIDEGGTVNRLDVVPPEGGNNWCTNSPPITCGGTPSAVFSAWSANPDWAAPYQLNRVNDSRYDIKSIATSTYTVIINRKSTSCPEGYDWQPFPIDGCAKLTPVPFPPSELEDAINSNYQPHPSDYPFLSSDPNMSPQSTFVDPIPRLNMPPTTTTTVDLDTGKTTTVTTNIWHDFNVKDNNSPQPKVEAETTEKSETYEDGVKTGESTTTSSSGTASGSDPVGSGSGQQLEIDIPTDCDFMPTVCAFIDWYKDDDLGDDPDLASIMKDDEEFAKTKVISFGAAVCPQPYTIHISSLSMSADLSFEFFCQFAEYARALVLAAAYIFAAYISLGVARG